MSEWWGVALGVAAIVGVYVLVDWAYCRGWNDSIHHRDRKEWWSW